MSATVDLSSILSAAKDRANQQWRADLEAARQRYTDAIQAAEDEYERARVALTPCKPFAP